MEALNERGIGLALPYFFSSAVGITTIGMRNWVSCKCYWVVSWTADFYGRLISVTLSVATYSCPAVSQSCNRTVRSSRYMVFDKKSMPMVACIHFESMLGLALTFTSIKMKKSQSTCNSARNSLGKCGSIWWHDSYLS